jgi:phosphomannomutase
MPLPKRSMLSVPSDTMEKNRICPVCGCEIESRICKKDGAKTLGVLSVGGVFVKKRMERGNLPGSELLRASKLGYDLRIDFANVEDMRGLSKDLVTYFEALEEVIKPKLVVFSRDQRNYGKFLQETFEAYAKEASPEVATVFGPICTTMSPYLGAMFSLKEKKNVMALHATASHNPSNYNGIKTHAGKFSEDIFTGKLEFSKQVEAEKAVESYVKWCTRSPYGEEVHFDLVNGAAVIPMPKLIARLYPQAKVFNDKLMPDFGGIRPEPGWFAGWTEFGVAFDGDADRCPFYKDSKMLFFSRVFAGMVKEGLVEEKKVVAGQRTPPQLVDFLKEHGVKVVMGMIGNTNQSILSQKEDALWFEENWHSGGYPVGKKRFPWGEAPFAVTFWLDKLKVPIDKLLEGVPPFEFSMEKFQTEPGFNEKIVALAEKRGLPYSELPSGGLRLENDKGHILFRESNTEIGAARLSASGVDQAALKENLSFGRKLVAGLKGHPGD